MSDWKDIGSNIIKLEGYGLYATVIDNEAHVCEMLPGTGLPKLDPDKCIDWEKLTDPPNQRFLNLVNAKFGTCFVMHDYGGSMTLTDIKEHSEQQRNMKKSRLPKGDI